jgi:phenylalanine-4-hydroxylase
VAQQISLENRMPQSKAEQRNLQLALKFNNVQLPNEDLPQTRRVFLRSKSHTDPALSCSDGIIIPHTFFSTLNDVQFSQVLKMHQQHPLMVAISDTRTFFNFNMNILVRKPEQSSSNFLDR